MAVTARARRSAPKGHDKPRIAPPVPLHHGATAYRELASGVGIELYPWQEHAAKYLTATGPNGRWLYKEVAIIVARQNGKTKLLIPLILQRLLDGQKVMHTAQNAKLPREVHEELATLLQEHYPNELPRKRAVSYAVGHEEIRLVNGGKYRIVAPTKGGARGPSNDLVIVDELREMEDHGFIGAAKPTLTVSTKPQMVYLSNAGTDDSEVLNAIKSRANDDPVLAYLEWSAAPERAADDIRGWEESNPSLGYSPHVLETLTDEYRSNKLAGTLALFEVEHLCRWQRTLREPLVDAFSWVRCKGDVGEVGTIPCLAVSMDPLGRSAAVALAWMRSDQTIGLKLLRIVTGDPIDTAKFGEDIRAIVGKMHIKRVGFDPGTDRELVKFFPRPKPEPIGGQLFANASAQFVNAVTGNRLRWDDADAVTDDLTWTSRKLDRETGSYQAVRAQDDRPIPASLAAIRAVWLASGPVPATPRVWT
jgi:hypothetical protein